MRENNVRNKQNVILFRSIEITLKITAISLLVFFAIQSYQYRSLFAPVEEGLKRTNEKIIKQNEHFQTMLTKLHENETRPLSIVDEIPSGRFISSVMPKEIIFRLGFAYVQALQKENLPSRENESTKNGIPSYKEIEAKYVIKLDGKIITTVADVCYSITNPPVSTPTDNQLDTTIPNLAQSSNKEKSIVLTVIGDNGTINHLPIENIWIEEIEKHEGDISKWKPGLCDSIDSQTVNALRRCLKMNLKNYQETEGDIWTARDRENLVRYQKENALPTGNTNFETLKKLGFQIYLQYKRA